MTTNILVTVLVSLSVASCEKCSVAEISVMQEEYNNCTLAGLEEEETCLMLNTVIGECGDIWVRCHEEAEVRRMRDLHLDTIIRREGQGELEECDLVREFRESGRNTSEETVEKCPQGDIARAQQMLLNCSHATSRSLHDNFHELEDGVMIAERLCQSLTVIANECVGHLQDCYRAEDLLMTRTRHLDQMREYLLRMFIGKVNESHLNECDVNDVNKTYEYDYGSYEDDDAANDQQINFQTTVTQSPITADVKTTRIISGVGDFILSTVTERILSELDKSEAGGGEVETNAGLTEPEPEERLPQSRKRKPEEVSTGLSVARRDAGARRGDNGERTVTPGVNATSEHFSRDMEDVTEDIELVIQELEVNKQEKVEDTSKMSILLPEPSIIERNAQNGVEYTNTNTVLVTLLSIIWLVHVM